MTRSSKPVDATLYLQVEPEWGSAFGIDRDDGERPLRGAKAVRMTQSRPREPLGGAVLVKITVRLPASAFYPLRPEAVVVIPEGYTETTPLEVLAVDPHEPPEPAEQ
jgi:hypothetical protein